VFYIGTNTKDTGQAPKAAPNGRVLFFIEELREPKWAVETGISPPPRQAGVMTQNCLTAVRVPTASPRRDIHRTWDRLLQQMLSLLEEKRKKENAMVV
jgi:hypothetical protein